MGLHSGNTILKKDFTFTFCSFVYLTRKGIDIVQKGVWWITELRVLVKFRVERRARVPVGFRVKFRDCVRLGVEYKKIRRVVCLRVFGSS